MDRIIRRRVPVFILLILAAIAADLVDGRYTRNPERTTVKVPYAKRNHPCEQSSCNPATGNLLIGRKNRLSASSTCGQQVEERYCPLYAKTWEDCMFCYASSPSQQHNISNIIGGIAKDSWWQAENEVENVTISFDLEAEFHLTYLSIRFLTFRPAAMLIERSHDFGKTWQVYRYFARECEKSFPEIPTHQPRNLTEAICESIYSDVVRESGDEIKYRVIPPNLHSVIDDPYSKEVQNLVKITNLRINFTKLHTFRDVFLNDGEKVREKYYYAVQDMVVKGSCNCYGHASACLELPSVINEEGMVHGRCECAHNTKGLNCEQCQDLYNDGPWKPAVGRKANACRKCNCNEHADSCHFDEEVYKKSGYVSGGVCDNCQHNTQGINCEQCKPSYYRDTSKNITHPKACLPCD